MESEFTFRVRQHVDVSLNDQLQGFTLQLARLVVFRLKFKRKQALRFNCYPIVFILSFFVFPSLYVFFHLVNPLPPPT